MLKLTSKIKVVHFPKLSVCHIGSRWNILMKWKILLDSRRVNIKVRE